MKKAGCILFVLLILLFFLLEPESALDAARNGLSLWFTQLLPSLLPFCILSYIVLASGLFERERPISGKRAKISGLEWYIICCGFLFGFPIGSKLTADSFREGKISRKNAMFLSCFTNNLSPVFVTAALREQLKIPVGVFTYLLIYGLPFAACILCLCLKGTPVPLQKKSASRFQLNMQIIDAGIMSGFETLIRICGYVMIFSIIAEMIHLLPVGNELIKLTLTGCLEVTNGIGLLAESGLFLQQKYLLAILFLCWNGLSGFCQTASILRQAELPVKNYLKMKLLLTAVTGMGAVLLLFFSSLL